MTVSFENRVAIVTGAGGGLGRAYALELARRGAKVVVNDMGGSRDGAGRSDAAGVIVDEVMALGGEAFANGANVAEPEEVSALAQEVVARWGRIDILINNAGILRDRSFAKMDAEDFRSVIDVHLIGTANCTKAVWDVMRAQNYGRILMTSSSSGLFGNFGQSNYGAAKLGILGLARTLHLEGAKYGIKVNTLAPTAATRMTEDIFPPAMLDAFRPEAVVPAALFLVSEDAPSNIVLGAGAGVYQAAFLTLTRGIALPQEEQTVEGVQAHWDAIIDRTGELTPQSGAEQAMSIIDAINRRGG